jgi:hypothetical protein
MWSKLRRRSSLVAAGNVSPIGAGSTLGKLAAEGKKQLGKPYDGAFDWSDSKMYCSELVWKIFHAALGVDLGEPKPLRSFDLTSPEVHAALSKRYGRSIPLDSVMIAPQEIYDSDLLEWVQGARESPQ